MLSVANEACMLGVVMLNDFYTQLSYAQRWKGWVKVIVIGLVRVRLKVRDS